jgi:hypothetical protein
MPWKKMEVREQRVEFVVRALRGTEPFSRLCCKFDISHPTGYLWLKRYREGGNRLGLPERSILPPRESAFSHPSLSSPTPALISEQHGEAARIVQVLVNQDLMGLH